MNQPFDRNPISPSCYFQIRLRRKVGDIAETEIGQHFDRSGNTEHPFERCVIQDADPSNPDPLASSGQPEILNRAADTVEIRLAHSRTSQDIPAASLMGAGHAEIDRRFHDPLELETAVEIGFGPCISGCCLAIHCSKQRLDISFRGRCSDHHEIPGLHEPDRARMMRGVQQPREHRVGNRRRQKIPADIPPSEDRPIDGRPLTVRKLSVTQHESVRMLHLVH